MPTTQPIYQPLNGKEIREILIKRATERINKIPMMKEGHAYHQAILAFSFTMTAVPADAPVPTMEFEESVSAPGFNLQDDYMNAVNKAESLQNKKQQLLDQIDKIDNLLEIVEESQEVEEIINAGTTPDNIRIDNDLPLPRVVTLINQDGSTKRVEKSINYDELMRQ